jgi:hypothetical protein
MKWMSSAVAACAVAALAITAIGAPATAASPKTKLTIVNGVAGKKVDVCVNGKEIRAGLPYGKFVKKSTRTQKSKVKFFVKNDRAGCRGKLLGKKTLSPGSATLVITRKAAKRVVSWSSPPQPKVPVPSLATQIIARHAADIEPIVLWYETHLADPYGIAVPVSYKGNVLVDAPYLLTDETDRLYAFMAVRRLGDTLPILRVKTIELRAGLLQEAILIGNTIRNARWVLVRRNL